MHHAIDCPGLFDARECGRIVALGSGAGFSDAGLVGGVREDGIRRARLAWLDESAGADWVLDRLMGTVREVNRTHFGFDLTEFAERMQLAWYGADAGGHFDWHVDIGDGPLARRRKLTVVVQLSDPADYEGGVLETNADARLRAADRSQGGATLFPGFVLHRVTPVTRGERHSLTTWVHGPPFR
jgi:PKHD-type hydroxylase